MSLPTDYDARKAIPLYTFLTGYFPLAIIEMTKVAVEGNKQHNPGEPLHWARGKSMNQLDTAMRHQFDHGMGKVYDTDGCMHLAKAMWRLGAEIQLIKEREAQGATVMTATEVDEQQREGIARAAAELGAAVGFPFCQCANDLAPGYHWTCCGLYIGDRPAAVIDSGLPPHEPGKTVDL